jgi:hypothetical protein
MTPKRVATRVLLVIIAALAFSRPTASQSLGTAASFAVFQFRRRNFQEPRQREFSWESEWRKLSGFGGMPG